MGGKDAASPRYIFTKISPLTRHLFNVHDDKILNYLNDDNQSIEPEWYIPILPMVLVNGAAGIGEKSTLFVSTFLLKVCATCPRRVKFAIFETLHEVKSFNQSNFWPWLKL